MTLTKYLTDIAFGEAKVIRIGNDFYNREAYADALNDLINRASLITAVGDQVNLSDKFLFDIFLNLAGFKNVHDANQSFTEYKARVQAKNN